MILFEIREVLREFLQGEEIFLWLLDSRILWGDLEERFHADFEGNDADLLATQIRRYAEDQNWTWWAHLKAPSGVNPLSSGVAALLPMVRFSRRAAEVVIEGIGKGWSGHPEAVIPTLVNRAGLMIEDIGGTGSFTPKERIGLWYDERTWHWRGPVEHVPGKLHFPLISRYHAKAPEDLAPEPKVAFLFLTRGDVHHLDIWEEYLEQTRGRARVLAHTKDTSLISEKSFLREAQIKEKIETEWASLSLVHATLVLLKTALADVDTTHFILVSESCVPVRPFDHLRMNLRRDDRSRMRMWSVADLKRVNPVKGSRMDYLTRIAPENRWFHDQWICLSREDALIVIERDWLQCFERVYIPDECYFATVLAASGKPPLDALVNRPITWTAWQGGAHPREFAKMLPRDVATISESGCFFARKFPPQSDIGKWGLHRFDQVNIVREELD